MLGSIFLEFLLQVSEDVLQLLLSFEEPISV
jgi:hypothetical protein